MEAMDRISIEHEKRQYQTVETLKEFVLQEAIFETFPSKAIGGINSLNKNTDSRRNRSRRVFFGLSWTSRCLAM